MTTFVTFSVTELLIFVIFIVGSLCIWSYARKPRNIPPGPMGLPVLGYLPFIKQNVPLQFKKLSEKYGEIFSVYVGHKLFIVLNSHEVIKEALVSENFAGRPVAYEKKNEVVAFLNSEGEVFKDHKRFALRTLRDLGLGKHSIETNIKEEIHFLLAKIGSFVGKPADLGDVIRMSVSNVTCALLHGKRFKYDDDHFQKLVSYVSEHLGRIHPIYYPFQVALISNIPGARYLFGSTYKQLTEMDQLLFSEIKKKMEQRSETHQYGTRNDFISAWLTEAEERKGSNIEKHFSIDYLTRVAQTLFIAGTDTTTNSLRWSLLYLMSHPEIQTKVQNEIDEIIGHERKPSFSDQDQMPYTTAVLMEVQRISSIVPFAVFHSNFEQTKLRNFTIPKRSVVIPNLWAAHHDPNVFPDPDKFQPERFLDSKGRIVKEHRLIPFSIGKRQCLGESLAKMELFLYFTSLFQRFKFHTPIGETLSFDYRASVVLMPRPFKVVTTER